MFFEHQSTSENKDITVPVAAQARYCWIFSLL